MKKSVIIIFLLFSPSLLFSEENGFVEKQKVFVKELYSKGRYFDFIAEAVRLQNFYSHEALDYCIYSAYYMGEQYKTVVNYYKPGLENEKMKLPTALLVSASHLKLKNDEMSFKVLKDFNYEGVEENYRFDLFKGRMNPLVFKDDIESIKIEISAADPFLKDDYNFTAMRQELLARENVSTVSVTGAAVMSAIVPGSGQIYSGFISAGILSFISVAATLAGGIYFQKKDEKGSAYTLFFFSGLFYAGNIYGAYNASSKANSRALKTWRESAGFNEEFFNPEKYCSVKRVFK